MLIVTLKKWLAINQAFPSGYVGALSTSYLLIIANIVVQFALTPLYLEHLGIAQFGVLMVMLSMINFASIGITWMSSGLVRIMGEYWAKLDHQGMCNAFVVGKYVYTLYALAIFFIGLIVWNYNESFNSIATTFSLPLLLGLYIVLNYENIPERQAFVATDCQTTGNLLELIKILVFVILVWLLLPRVQDISIVWVALLSGIIVQRVLTGAYWSRRIKGLGWRSLNQEMKPLVKRLIGRQGAGYASYGILLLILQADIIIIGWLGGSEVAAQFVLLWKIPEAIGFFLWRIPSVLEPRIIQLDSTDQKQSIHQLFHKGRFWFFLLVTVVALSYSLLGQMMTELWVGQYAPGTPWMYWLAGGALFFNATARWPIAFAHGLLKLKNLVTVAATEVVIKVLVTVLLFDLFGIVTPIIATIIAHSLYAFFAYQNLINWKKFK